MYTRESTGVAQDLAATAKQRRKRTRSRASSVLPDTASLENSIIRTMLPWTTW